MTDQPTSKAIYATVRGRLAPVANDRPWIVAGFLLQLAGVVAPVAYLLLTARKLSIAGHITGSTFRLAWRADAHTTVGLTLLIGGAIVFAVGSVLLARPYVTRRVTLFLAVPLAAATGMTVFGVLAFFVVAAAAIGWDFLDVPDLGRQKRKKARK